jgi:hypothetical protein
MSFFAFSLTQGVKGEVIIIIIMSRLNGRVHYGHQSVDVLAGAPDQRHSLRPLKQLHELREG